MKNTGAIAEKIMTPELIPDKIKLWRSQNKTIAFTNGVFDILHEGHIFSLSQAANEADLLIVGLNSDTSVKKLKGNSRPVNKEQSRAIVLASLQMVDAVIIFSEETPLELIKAILPDVLIKGGDYKPEEIAGSKEIIANGGRVVINKLIPGISTTGIIKSMKDQQI